GRHRLCCSGCRMLPTRSVLASCEPYPHSAQPCRPSPRVSITGRADVTTSSFTGDEFFVTTAVLTPLRAETFRSGLRRPCGLERPQRADAHHGSTPTAGRDAQAGRDTCRISAVRRSQPTASARPCRRTTTRIHHDDHRPEHHLLRPELAGSDHR